MWLTDVKNIVKYVKYYGQLPRIPDSLETSLQREDPAGDDADTHSTPPLHPAWQPPQAADSWNLYDDHHYDWSRAESKAHAYGFRYSRRAKQHLDDVVRSAGQRVQLMEGGKTPTTIAKFDSNLTVTVATDLHGILNKKKTAETDDLSKAPVDIPSQLTSPRIRPVLLDQFCGLLKRNDKWAKSEAEKEEYEAAKNNQEPLDLRDYILSIIVQDDAGSTN